MILCQDHRGCSTVILLSVYSMPLEFLFDRPQLGSTDNARNPSPPVLGQDNLRLATFNDVAEYKNFQFVWHRGPARLRQRFYAHRFA